MTDFEQLEQAYKDILARLDNLKITAENADLTTDECAKLSEYTVDVAAKVKTADLTIWNRKPIEYEGNITRTLSDFDEKLAQWVVTVGNVRGSQ